MAFAKLIAISLLFAVIQPSSASAGVAISERIRTYTVTGQTIQDVVKSMKRRGPESELHGRRALGLSDFRHRISTRTTNRDGKCRFSDVKVTLRIYHTWPKLSERANLSGSHLSRWRVIRRMIIAHERRHGALYRQFARELRARLLRIPPQSSCTKLRTRQRAVTKLALERDRARNRRYDRIQYRPFNRRLKRLAPK